MKKTYKIGFSLLCLAILLAPMSSTVLATLETLDLLSSSPANQRYLASDGITGDLIPMRRVAFVAQDSSSYIDDFSYMAAVPTSVFLHDDTQYISPLIYSMGSNSETWLVEDWVEYLGSAEDITQAISIGDFSEPELQGLQNQIGTRIFPRITGHSSAHVAAQLAMMDWDSSNTAVVAFAKDAFQEISIISGSASHTFDSPSITPFSTTATVHQGTLENVTFTPPVDAGWMEGSFDWGSTDLLTHVLYDPSGTPVDYSVENQVIFERNPSYVDELVPLHFWYPRTQDGTWTLSLNRLSAGFTSGICSVAYHPGFSQTVNVPENAKWFNVTATWDNSGTDLNFAMINPEGRLVTWAPAESLIAGLLSESMQVPYPMSGEWTIISAWMNPESEQNNLELDWDISLIPSDLQYYLESAANGAVLASLLNTPLLYVDEDEVPEITSQAISRLGIDEIILVDPSDIHANALATELAGLVSVVNVLDSYPLMTQAIQTVSSQPDVILTIPTGTGEEFFPSAAYSGAFHGAPVFSLCGDDNLLTTRAEETWHPYFIGPQIDVFVQDRWVSRTETGWYDERIPHKYVMMNTTGVFEQFLINRGAYNSSNSQLAVILSPIDLIKTSFDRSLQTHFSPGRIPARDGALASIFVNRAALHRFLFLTAESADEALMSLYAYTDGAPFLDNFFQGYEINQIEDTQNALETEGFTTLMHVGADAVFNAVDSQVAFWAFSTHGTLTNGPRDPPARPDGPGYFSMRDVDTTFGFEFSTDVRDYNNDKLVNPVVYESEYAHHILRSTDDMEIAIGNIGSPIITLTACLLGGTRLPLMLMKHGAVGVTAAPRTVYFQPAGMLSILMVQALCEGNSTGEALSYGHRLISSDFTDPLVSRDPRDYANQQILFGDPGVKLYLPANNPRISALNPLTSSFDGHTPGSGIPNVVGLGSDVTLPSTLESLGADFEYYSPTNFTLFEYIYPLVPTVIIGSEEFDTFSPLLETSSYDVEDYIRSGGTLAILGMNGDASWLPWPLTLDDTPAGTSITIVDAEHPLISSPNTLDATVSYQGALSLVWSNLTVLATDGSNPVIVAGVIGSGKLAITTTVPLGLDLNATIENILSWGAGPSLTLRNIQTNQFIIWEGDRVVLTIDITNRAGDGITGVALGVSINDTAVNVVEVGSGVYTVTLDEAWTSGRVGTFDLQIAGRKAGYDSLSIVLIEFLTIRQLPILGLAILGGVVAVVGVGAFALRRRRGGGGTTRRRRGESKEAQQRRKEKDERFDAKEFFGV